YSAFLSDDGRHPMKFLRPALVQRDDFVGRIINFPREPRLLRRQPRREIASFEVRQDLQQQSRIDGFRSNLRHPIRLSSHSVNSPWRILGILVWTHPCPHSKGMGIQAPCLPKDLFL